MIKIGDRLPDATLQESTEMGEHCPAAPSKLSAAAEAKGKRVVIFGLPGAYTPTCSAQHVPGYLEHLDGFKAKGVDEVWCVAVNDGFVMAAWGRDQKAFGKIRFFGDGSAELTKKLGIELDLTAGGLGVRMRRFSMFVDDGVVKAVNVEEGGQLTISGAETLLKQLD